MESCHSHRSRGHGAALLSWLESFAVEHHCEQLHLGSDFQMSLRVSPREERKDSFTLGAFEKNALVGIISLERDRRVKLRHKALLFRMFVVPEVAGRGVGKSLLQEALSRTQGIDDLRCIHLTALERNQRARALYRSLGFVDFALEPEAVQMDADYADEVQMIRFLRR